MKRIILVFAFAISLWSGCKKDEGGANNGNPPAGSNYFPFVLGRMWQYNASGTLPNGSVDPRSLHTMTATVFQMGQNIGGQPNATIIRATYNTNRYTDNLVFYAEPTKLWTYNSPTTTSSYTSMIYWQPGFGYAITSALNKIQKYWVYDWFNYQGVPCQITRAPLSSIATARIIAPDTVEIRGVGVGQRFLLLQE